MARDEIKEDPLARLAWFYGQTRPCPTGKVVYPDTRSAWLEARRMSKIAPKYGPNRPAEPFRCPECGQIHIGRRS